MKRLVSGRRLFLAATLAVVAGLAYSQAPGSGIAHLRQRREARRYVVDAKKFYSRVSWDNRIPAAEAYSYAGPYSYAAPCSYADPCESVYAEPAIVVPTVTRTGNLYADDNVARATTFTSDQPKLILVATQPAEYLYYDLTNETYWVIGPQYVKGLSRTQSVDYIAKNPVSVVNSDYVPAAQRVIASAESIESDENWAAPLAQSTSAADAVLKRIADSVPATVKLVDKTKQAGWADYDGDGVADEIFPQERTVVNPEIIKVLKELDAAEATASNQQE